MSVHPLWDYKDARWSGGDLIGYSVDAVDGAVGKVDKATDMVDGTCLVVDTGPWIFGHKVVIPVGLVYDVDDRARSIIVDRTVYEVKTAPPYDEEMFYDDAYRDELEAYYGPRQPVAVAPWDRGETA